jgi:hypothetical protein
MKNAKIPFVLLLMLGLLFGAAACTQGIRLNTQGAQDSEVAGNYTVIYYGCNFFNDLETIAFLQKESSGYDFEPYAPDFQYRVKKGLPAKEAMDSAMKFVGCNASFSRAQMSGILGPKGEIIGYEVRPLYRPFTYGAGDVLFVNYSLKDGKVVINVRLLDALTHDSGLSPKEK